MGLGVTILPQHVLAGQGPGHARFACGTTGAVQEIACDSLLLVTGRLPVDDLWCDLAGYPNLARVGDCLAPSSIADAVHSAHRYVRLLGEPDLPPRRERPSHRSM
jgi:dimethylamine/trimethylamine dehydrogenase